MMIDRYAYCESSSDSGDSEGGEVVLEDSDHSESFKVLKHLGI